MSDVVTAGMPAAVNTSAHFASVTVVSTPRLWMLARGGRRRIDLRGDRGEAEREPVTYRVLQRRERVERVEHEHHRASAARYEPRKQRRHLVGEHRHEDQVEVDIGGQFARHRGGDDTVRRPDSTVAADLIEAAIAGDDGDVVAGARELRGERRTDATNAQDCDPHANNVLQRDGGSGGVSSSSHDGVSMSA